MEFRDLVKDSTFTFKPQADMVQTYLASGLYSIHSVRRLSDGVVFSVGDMCEDDLNGRHDLKIKEFELKEKWDGGLAAIFGEHSGCIIKHLSKTQPIPQRTNTSIKNEPVTGYVIQSNNGFEYPGFDIAWQGDVRDKQTNYKYDEMFFDNKEAADKFLLNKLPCLTLEDVMNCTKGMHPSEYYYLDKDKLETLIKSKL